MNWIPLPTNLLPHWFFPWNNNSWSGYTPYIFHKELLAVDAIRQIFVWKEFAFSLLRQGIWPLWNPYNFSGQPLLANFQSSIFYPPSWVFLFFSPVIAWSIYIYIQPILAGIFMYLFLSERKLSRHAAIFGAFAFIFCSYLATRYFWGVCIHPLLWIPLGFWLIDKFNSKKIPVKVFIVFESMVLALSILGGYPQHGLFALIIQTLYFIFLGNWRKFHIFLVALFLAGLLSAAQLLPTAELYKNSIREASTSNSVFRDAILPSKYLISIVSPDYWGSPGTNNYFGGKDYSGMNGYFGIIPLALAMMAVLSLRKRKEIKFWTILALGGLIFAYDNPLAQLPNLLRIPILSSGGAWGNLFFWQLAGVILSAYGFDMVFVKRNKGFIFVLMGLLIVGGVLLFIGRSSVITFRNTGLIAGILSLFFVTYLLSLKWAKVLGLILLFLSGIFYLQKVSPLGLEKYYYPQHPVLTYLQQNSGFDRFWGFGGSRLAANFSAFFRIQSPEGYDSLWPQWYGELLSGALTGNVLSKIDRADVVISDKNTVFRRRLLNLLGVKYFLGDVVSIDEESYPRAFLVDSYMVVPRKDQVQTLLNPDFDARNIVLVDQELNKNNLSTGEAKIVDYQASRVKIKTKSESSSILFLSDTYYPGWQVRINGQKGIIFRADYAFRAVVVPGGENEVVFSYEPDSFRYGAILSVVGIGVLLCLIIGSKRS